MPVFKRFFLHYTFYRAVLWLHFAFPLTFCTINSNIQRLTFQLPLWLFVALLNEWLEQFLLESLVHLESAKCNDAKWKCFILSQKVSFKRSLDPYSLTHARSFWPCMQYLEGDTSLTMKCPKDVSSYTTYAVILAYTKNPVFCLFFC